VTDVRLLTCNLFNGRADPEALASVLASTAPDVVAVQELAPNAAEVLTRFLPYGRLEPALNSTGIGIALRYPGTVDRFAMEQRSGLSTILNPIEWPKLHSGLEVVTVHLANPLDRPLGQTRRLRRSQVAAVVNHVARMTQPLVVAGDLNATPAWPVYRRLTRVMRDGVHDTGTVKRTWGPRWWWPRLLRIDHVLVRGGVRVVRAETISIRGSDHSGLLADLDVA
jgi:endonuclease/exonuclease/phosphatase (EEP) superfamily protein YafD